MNLDKLTPVWFTLFAAAAVGLCLWGAVLRWLVM